MTGDGTQLIMHHAMFIKNVLSIVSFLCPCTSTMDEQDSKVERGCLKINVVDKKNLILQQLVKATTCIAKNRFYRDLNIM